jgi:hypothetical protein
MPYDPALDVLSARDSREAFSAQEQLTHDEKQALYAEAEMDGFFDTDFFMYGFEVGGEG